MASLHSLDHYKAVTRELRDAGLSWTEEMGGKHAKLIIDLGGGQKRVQTLSVSPGCRATVKASVGSVRRMIKEWKAEAAAVSGPAAPAMLPDLEDEGTMDDTGLAVSSTSDDLVFLRDGRATTDSRRVAAKFEREHKSVLRSIRDLIRHEPSLERNFVPFKNNDLIGDTSHYEIDRDGFSLLAMGFTGSKALRWKLQYIAAFNAMQDALTHRVFDDETEALLTLIGEARADIVRAQQSSAGTALEHIDGAKAAVLHYLKAYLREPATAFYEDVRHRNVAAYKRDHQVISALGELNRRIGDLIALAGPTVAERPFLWSEWFDTARIYAEHFPGRVIPKKGFLSTAIAKGLDSYCKQTRNFHHMEQRVVGGHPRNFWHKDAVWAWLEAGGRDLVEQHISRHAPRTDNVVQIGRG